ncbi:MAG: hypothetical protein V3T77_04125, partial [Planctomycetota bacterium]
MLRPVTASALLLTLLVGSSVDANMVFKFSQSGGQGSLGMSLDLRVTFINEKDEVEGWSIGVCHDGSLLQINSLANGATTQGFNDGEGPDLYFPNVFQDPPEGPGWNAGVVISIGGAETLGPNPGGNPEVEIHLSNYTVLDAPAEGEDPFITDVCPCDEQVGGPPTPLVAVTGGFSFPVDANCGTVVITSPPTITFKFIVKDQTVIYDGKSGDGSFEIDTQIGENPGNEGFPNQTQGFSMGLAHDGSLLVAKEIFPTGDLAAINDGEGPELLFPNVFPDEGATMG